MDDERPRKKRKNSLSRDYTRPDLSTLDHEISPIKGDRRLGNEKEKIEHMNNEEFIKHFRMGKDAFIQLYSLLAFVDKKFQAGWNTNLTELLLYCQQIWNDVAFLRYFRAVTNNPGWIPLHLEYQGKNVGTPRIPLWGKLLCTLNYLGTGVITSTVFCHMSYRTLFNFYHGLIAAINIILRKTIHFPFGNREKLEEMRRNSASNFLPGCLGSIDGTKIELQVLTYLMICHHGFFC